MRIPAAACSGNKNGEGNIGGGSRESEQRAEQVEKPKKIGKKKAKYYRNNSFRIK